MKGGLLGPCFSNDEIDGYLKFNDIPYKRYNENELFSVVSEYLSNEKVIGWFQGKMEFGPRSLGSRSIIGDPRSKKMQEMMNVKIKFRESFRPFAPSVLAEKVNDWFDLTKESPYMLLVAPVKKEKQHLMTDAQEKLFGIDKLNISRSDIPAVTHVDYSARIQTVNENTDIKYYSLIKTFDKNSGCPVIVNTSFNVRGEPPVCTPEDAYRCFMRTDMDYLVLGDFILNKKMQPDFSSDDGWKEEFELD